MVTTSKSLPELQQVLRFISVGAANTLLDAGVYFALTRTVAALGSLPAAAKALSYCAGILASFYLNRSWTFRAAVETRRALPLFAAVNLAGLAVNAGLMQLCNSGLNLPELAALGASTAGACLWNFCAYKWLVFAPANAGHAPQA